MDRKFKQIAYFKTKVEEKIKEKSRQRKKSGNSESDIISNWNEAVKESNSLPADDWDYSMILANGNPIDAKIIYYEVPLFLVYKSFLFHLVRDESK